MKQLKYALKHEWYILILLILPFIAIPFIWTHLPSQIPTHWNMQGEVNGSSSRLFGILFTPMINIAIYLLFLYLPKIDPKKRVSYNQKPMPVIRLIVVLLLFCIQGWTIYAALGYHATTINWFFLVIALFFILMGNYLSTVQPNYFIGIRVPWTLEDESNWHRTHHMASWLWVIGGIVLLILFPILRSQLYSYFFIAIIIILSLAPIIFSFYIFKTEPHSKQ